MPPIKNSSGTFEIREPGQIEPLFSIDLTKKKNEWGVEYNLPGGISFIGASANKIFVDKLAVISGEAVLERIKDVYDMYLLSHLNGFVFSILQKIKEQTKRKYYEFDGFLHEKNIMEQQYETLRDVINPPTFNVVYGRVRDFCMPFIINPDVPDCEWYVAEQKWIAKSL